MSGIILKGNRYSGNTIVSNYFIDEYMSEANGAQLKIYLYLMRCIEADDPVTVSSIADRFNYTETDIIRSLLYWARKGIVSLEFDEDGAVTGIVLNDPSEACEREVSIPKKSAGGRRRHYTAADVREFGRRAGVKELIFATEQYLSHPLSPSEMKSLIFMNESLEFSPELIEYLIEYCVSKGKTSMRYIEQTAMNWKDKGVSDIESAREQVRSFANGDYYTVLKAFGLSDRKPVESEMEYVDRWKDEYGFSMDIILEAVGRTMKRTARPSFPYADSILRRWSESGVQSADDIAGLDDEHERKTAQIRDIRPRKAAAANKFHNFSTERQYDYDEIEAELLRKRQ